MYDITVAADHSFIADGIAVSNCRCSVVEVFDMSASAIPPRAVDVDGKMVQPRADPRFAANFATVFEEAA